jgi:hypothetical protein
VRFGDIGEERGFVLKEQTLTNRHKIEVNGIITIRKYNSNRDTGVSDRMGYHIYNKFESLI